MASDGASITNPQRKYKVIAALLAAVTIAMLVLFYSSGEDALDALAVGQRVIINATTGDITSAYIAPPPTKKAVTPIKTPLSPKQPTQNPALNILPAGDKKPLPKKQPIPTTSIPNSPASSPESSSKPKAAILPDNNSSVNTTKVSHYDAYADFVGEEEGENSADIIGSPLNTPSRNTVDTLLDAGIDTIPAYPRTNASLAIVNTDLLENTEHGSIPRMGNKNQRPSNYYARPVIENEAKDDVKVTVSIIVTGLGLNKNTTQQALTLPYDVSLSFNPYARYSAVWAESARNLGFEAWMDIPMQPEDYPASDPGPDALLASNDSGENLARLKRIMARFAGYVGVVTPASEQYSVNRSAMTSTINALKKRGLYMIFGNHNASIIKHASIAKNKQHIAVPDVIIDQQLNARAIKTELETLKQKALAKGHAVGLAHAYPLSITHIAEWLTTLNANVRLVPVSAVVGK